MKTNIKMRVTPVQLEKICNIISKGWLYFKSANYMYIFNDSSIEVAYSNENWNKYELEEIDADLFIRTNGTCEEISDEGLSKIKAAFQGKPIEYLQEKVINLHKQINKDRIIIKNQKEELNKLNIKLQKCISLEEHNKIIEKINKGNVNYLSNSIISRDKEIEKLKAIIEYLESKVK